MATGISMELRRVCGLWAVCAALMVEMAVLVHGCPNNALEQAMKCTARLGLDLPGSDNTFVDTGQVDLAIQACREGKLQAVVACVEEIMAVCQGSSDQEHFLRTMVDVDKSRKHVTFFCSHLDEYEQHAPCIAQNHAARTQCVKKEQRNMQTKVKASVNMDFLMTANCRFFHTAELCSRRVLTLACGKEATDLVAAVFSAFKPPLCDTVTDTTDNDVIDGETGAEGGTAGADGVRPSLIATILTLALVMACCTHQNT